MINKNKRLRILAVTIIIVISLGFNIFSCIENAKLSDQYTGLVCITNQFSKTNLVTFVISKEVCPQQTGSIEIFDIKNGQVVKTVPSNPTIQNQGIHFLNGITGPYEKVTGFPEEGFIVKIPYEPSLAVENRWLNTFGIKSLHQIFILFPKQQKPYLLVLDDKNRPFFYNFQGDTAAFLNELHFQP